VPRTPGDESLREVVDQPGLRRFLEEHLPGLQGPFSIERLGEGQSNLTFLIRSGDREVVLRRPPRGELPPTAHDVRREYRVMDALWKGGRPVPVPRPLALCEDPSIIGAPFYLMERIDGVVVRETLPPALSGLDDRRNMAEAVVDIAVALHGTDHEAIGLQGFGKPQGFLERQIRRMGGLWDLARFREIPEIDRVGAWLADHLPTQAGTTIVHGDYKLDNIMFAPAPPVEPVAVVDWELSTLGDPQSDVGWLLYFWREEGEPDFGIPVASVTDQPGFPHRAALLQRYAEATGAAVDDIRWYVALAGWKIAIIMEGSYRRYRAGVGDHPTFARLDRAVPGLARRALAAISGELAL
jgi:aminoglycoside phosphotransferase (APT) family kinase protein